MPDWKITNKLLLNSVHKINSTHLRFWRKWQKEIPLHLFQNGLIKNTVNLQNWSNQTAISSVRPDWAKLLLYYWQGYGFSSLCVLMCCFRTLDWANPFLHCWHEYGFSQLWILKCFLHTLDWVNPLLHCQHVCHLVCLHVIRMSETIAILQPYKVLH